MYHNIIHKCSVVFHILGMCQQSVCGEEASSGEPRNLLPL